MKSRLSRRTALVLAIAFAAAPTLADEMPTDETIIGVTWRAVAIDGAAPGNGIAIDLRIEPDGVAAGRAACNRYTTRATIDGDTIAFAPVATTRMMCDESTMKVEAAFLAALDSTRRFSLDAVAGELHLHDEDGSTLVLLARE